MACGAGARGFALLLHHAKAVSGKGHPSLWVAAAGASIATLIGLGRWATGRSPVLGSGYPAVAWAFEPHHAVAILLALFVLRALATAGAVAGGASC